MSSIKCTIHLVCLKPDISNTELLKHMNDPSTGRPAYLIKAKAHGWVHRPHLQPHREKLLAHRWDTFFLTRQSELPGKVDEIASTHLSIEVSIPEKQYRHLESQVNVPPKPNLATPPLPKEWPDKGGIPGSAITESSNDALKPGELRLDHAMADFLSNSLPHGVLNEPVGLFNLFMYTKGDSSTHEHYMEGFKRDFGDAAGVAMQFMGPVKSDITYEKQDSSDDGGAAAVSSTGWQDANLVQYDTIWHYAYMLSTDTYAKLNEEKVSGLEDTCILLTSEMELAL